MRDSIFFILLQIVALLFSHKEVQWQSKVMLKVSLFIIYRLKKRHSAFNFFNIYTIEFHSETVQRQTFQCENEMRDILSRGLRFKRHFIISDSFCDLRFSSSHNSIFFNSRKSLVEKLQVDCRLPGVLISRSLQFLYLLMIFAMSVDFIVFVPVWRNKGQKENLHDNA